MVTLLCETATQPRSPVRATNRREQSSISEPPGEAASDNLRRGRDRFRWFGISGVDSVTKRRTQPRVPVRLRRRRDRRRPLRRRPMSSPGCTTILRLASPGRSSPRQRAGSHSFSSFGRLGRLGCGRWDPTRPRWKLLIHIPGALGFALGHVGGFVLLRRFVAWMGGPVTFDPSFVNQFLYEAQLDGLSYLLLIASFTLLHRLGGGQAPIAAPDPRVTFDIRDGAKLIRVRIDDILAVSSAGNYVEFTLGDGRRPLCARRFRRSKANWRRSAFCEPIVRGW